MSFLASLKPVTTTSAVNYFKGFFVCRETKFLPLRVSRMLLQLIVFSIRIFFTDTDDSQNSRGREGTIFYFTLPLPPAHKHWDIYLQLCMWDDYHVFLIATPVFTRLLLWDLPPYRITIWVIDWWCNVCLFTWWIDTRYLLQRFDIGNRRIWTRIDYHPCITTPVHIPLQTITIRSSPSQTTGSQHVTLLKQLSALGIYWAFSKK